MGRAAGVGYWLRDAYISAQNVLSCLSASILLFAAQCFFLGRSDHSAGHESIAVIAVIILLSALALSFFRSGSIRFLTFANCIAALLLFGPSMIALPRRTGTTPQPKQLWSRALQQGTWQDMNTGSDYAATRQVVFEGDRVIVVFDAGFAPSQPPRDKWPVSTYRLMSLDVKTGAERNEVAFPGRWGSMPYIYSTRTGVIDVQSNPPRMLHSDLTPASDPASTAPVSRVGNQVPPGCGASCDPPTYVLGDDRLLQMRQRHFQIVDSTGRILRRGDLTEWGAFAGASADGRRFAVDSSYTEGDPDFVVYEYFTIYDVAAGSAISSIQIKDFPARRSWSAFSPDGRYFVAGNPNKLTMYELP